MCDPDELLCAHWGAGVNPAGNRKSAAHLYSHQLLIIDFVLTVVLYSGGAPYSQDVIQPLALVALGHFTCGVLSLFSFGDCKLNKLITFLWILKLLRLLKYYLS